MCRRLGFLVVIFWIQACAPAKERPESILNSTLSGGDACAHPTYCVSPRGEKLTATDGVQTPYLCNRAGVIEDCGKNGGTCGFMPSGSVDVCQAANGAAAGGAGARSAAPQPSCDADVCRHTFANGAVEIVSVKLNSAKYQIFGSPQAAADEAASKQTQGRDYFTQNSNLVAMVNANFFRSVGDNRVRGLAIGEAGKVITNQHDAGLGGTWSVIYCQTSRTCNVVRDLRSDPAEISLPNGVDFAATGYGDTIIQGTVNARADDRFPNEARPRTQLGISSSRWYIGVMKAGKNSQLAEYMLKAGAKDAMILDGGGSTFMYLRPPLAMDAGVETIIHTTRPVPHYIGIRKAN